MKHYLSRSIIFLFLLMCLPTFAAGNAENRTDSTNFFPVYGAVYQYWAPFHYDIWWDYDFYNITVSAKDTLGYHYAIYMDKWYRQSGDTLYRTNNPKGNEDNLYINFNINDYSTYLFKLNDTTYGYIGVSRSNSEYLGHNYPSFASWADAGNSWMEAYEFIRDIGIVSRNYYYSIPGPGSRRPDPIPCIGAIVYDSLGNIHDYTDPTKPIFVITPLTAIRDSLFNLEFNVKHKYIGFGYNEMHNTTYDAVVYVNKVQFEYFYQKGDSATEHIEIPAVRDTATYHWRVWLNANTGLMKNGWSLKYKLSATDISLVPKTKVIPDSGYYSCVLDTTLTNVSENDIKLPEFKLNNNYPNPFNPSTAISYSLPKGTMVKINVYNVLGKQVYGNSSYQSEGDNKIIFNGSNLASGTYIYVISAEGINKILTGKMLLLK